MNHSTDRPVFLNLLRIRQSAMALLSIFHRISGILMVLALPALVYLLGLSLRDAQGFAQAVNLLQHPVARFVLLLLGWALAHHMLAGIRFMLLDVDVGITRAAARNSAWLVLLVGLAVLVSLFVFYWLPGVLS
ncbi:MAG: succinate dehydrogenase, cytochrome b556 subunit [Gammaproteobacteria bacterium]|nr:succinate dehydrogenase, cytochrome b556 subunit [Gammaproteobacteria bacterium]